MTGRRKDDAAWNRVRSVLDSYDGKRLTHAQVAAIAETTYEVVRAVRRERGDVGTTPRKPELTGSRLLRGLEQRHIDALKRLDAAHRRGSDMRTRAVLGGADMQQLLKAAREIGAQQ